MEESCLRDSLIWCINTVNFKTEQWHLFPFFHTDELFKVKLTKVEIAVKVKSKKLSQPPAINSNVAG